jgi:hypothetical protein
MCHISLTEREPLARHRDGVTVQARYHLTLLVPCQNSRMGSELVFPVPVRLLCGTR